MPAVAGEAILIHVGDATMFSRPPSSIDRFNDWIGSLPYNHKVFVPGNHESYISEDLRRRTQLSNATVLINQSVDIAGLKLWGSPVVPLANTAFGTPSAAERRHVYSTIPDDTDILITHGPPFGIFDIAHGSRYHSGCPELLEAVQRASRCFTCSGTFTGRMEPRSWMVRCSSTLRCLAGTVTSTGSRWSFASRPCAEADAVPWDDNQSISSSGTTPTVES
jgi:hypothetical protein